MHSLNSRTRIDTGRTLALVLAGGRGSRLHGLTQKRAKPAVPFGGHHRIVDYSLSNCVNSMIPNIAVLTQYKAQSLIRHLQRNWCRMTAMQQPIDIWPAQQRNGDGWYAGTADAVHQNRDLIEGIDPDYVLILAGDHVYEMDYANLIAAHMRNRADVTIACVEVAAQHCSEFGIVEVDEDLKLTGFLEKPSSLALAMQGRDEVLASMGIYLFGTDALLHYLDQDARDRESRHDFGRDIIPRIGRDGGAYASLFRTRSGAPGYWQDVGTIDRYWRAHLDLLEADACSIPQVGNWSPAGSPQGGPACITASACVSASALGSASLVCGTVDRSVVSAGCELRSGSVVQESVLLPGVVVGRNCRLDRVVVDSRCRIPDNTVLDAGTFASSDSCYVSPAGIVLITEETLAGAVPEYERKLVLQSA